ncbi:MAG: A24 family peptidase [Gemmatimonadaceae bacterium]|nr:prepilin peptidase [Gemmatimonadota bacterium]
MRLFDGAPVGVLAGIVFTTLLVVAAVGDIRHRRIPNSLVATLAVLGVVFSVYGQGVTAGLLTAVQGFAIGLAVWLPFYLVGWLGAGDVKLYAAAGAWLGPARTLEGALIAALVGALLAFIWMLKSQGVGKALATLGIAAGSPGILASGRDTVRTRPTLPYGVAIALGAICAAWIPGLLFA